MRNIEARTSTGVRSRYQLQNYYSNCSSPAWERVRVADLQLEAPRRTLPDLVPARPKGAGNSQKCLEKSRVSLFTSIVSSPIITDHRSSAKLTKLARYYYGSSTWLVLLVVPDPAELAPPAADMIACYDKPSKNKYKHVWHLLQCGSCSCWAGTLFECQLWQTADLQLASPMQHGPCSLVIVRFVYKHPAWPSILISKKWQIL